MQNQYRLIIIGILLLVALPALLAQQHPGLNPTNLDISKPLGDLPGVTTKSTPAEITAAIQQRLDYLYTRNTPGRVFLPEGDWAINQPLFMTESYKELVGAGMGKTVLRAADGYRGMPMINLCMRSYQSERPIVPANRVCLTDPAARVLDDSVTDERYGVRTYTEYPSTDFPRSSHLAIPTPKQAVGWKAGTAYKVNDLVTLNPLNSGRGIDAICTQAHTASAENQPYTGKDWKNYWILRLSYNLQFVGDPLAAGPLDPVTKRASNWAGVQQFTFDLAFTFNADPALYKEQGRPICGAISSNCDRPQGRTWLVMLHGDGNLYLDITLADGTPRSFLLAPCKAAGTYRLSCQFDFPHHGVRAWVRVPGQADFTRTLNDTTSLPANSGFQPLEYGFFSVAGGTSGSPAQDNLSEVSPIDITVAGLHMSNTLRYADAAPLQRRKDEAPTSDNFRYFSNDQGTFAFLPLSDNPPASAAITAGRLITVQHGEAAGDAKQRGYGFLQVPSCTCGIVMQRVSDMTLQPGPVWGAGILSWNMLDSKVWNMDIRGGYYAIGDLAMGAQYTFDIRDSVLSGSEAAYNGMSNIFYMENVTINPVGRCGILLSGSNAVLNHVKFVDPTTFKSEYYFRHIFATIYGGMNTLKQVTAEAPVGSLYPSKAAFSMQKIWIFRTCMILDDCHVANMGPKAAFLNLDFEPSDGHGIVTLTKCRYTGNPIAAFIRAADPWWSGPVHDYDTKTPVKKVVDVVTPAFPLWKENIEYKTWNMVVCNGIAYRPRLDHKSSPANQPGTPEAAKTWQQYTPNFKITTLP